jgi:hypothetical protein
MKMFHQRWSTGGRVNKVPSAVFALTCSHRLFSLLSFASFQGSILSGKNVLFTSWGRRQETWKEMKEYMV